jgi:uncharacterized protein (DUF58 family)
MTSRPAVFIIGFLVLLGIVLKSPMLFLLSILLVLVAGASAAWERYCLAGVTYVRRFGAHRLFCGEETDLWVEIVNAKPLPLAWLKTEDEFPDELTIHKAKHKPSGQPHRRLLTNLLSVRWYERVRRHYRMAAHQRGVFDFGPAAVSSGDIFRFRTRRQEIDHRHTVLVYPKVAPMDRLDLRAARPLGDFGAQRRIADDPLRLAERASISRATACATFTGRPPRGAAHCKQSTSIRAQHINWSSASTTRRSNAHTEACWWTNWRPLSLLPHPSPTLRSKPGTR